MNTSWNSNHLVAALLAALTAALGCGGPSEPPPEYAAMPYPPPPAEPVDPTPPPPPPAPAVTVEARDHTPIEGDVPTLRITSPRPNQRIRSGNVMLRIELRGWPLAPDPGNHVHVIIDNEPYIAVRDVSAPIDLNALVREHLGAELAEGTHVVRVFPSRGHHESVKDARAFASVVFHYRRATPGVAFDASAPLLTYSRPKGCVVAGTPMLVDFFVSNVELGDAGARVAMTLDERPPEMLTSWRPHYVSNLPAGSHTIRLSLVGADGAAIAGPFNDTTRAFSVAESCAAPAAAVVDPHANH